VIREVHHEAQVSASTWWLRIGSVDRLRETAVGFGDGASKGDSM